MGTGGLVEQRQAGDAVVIADAQAIATSFGGADFIGSAHGAFSSGGMTWTANRLYLTPFLTLTPVTFTGLTVYLSTAAGTKLRIGISGINADGSVGSVLADSGDLSTASTGYVTGTFTAVTIPPGWYLLYGASDGAIVTTSLKAESHTILGLINGNVEAFAYRSLNGGWTGLPDISGTWTANNATVSNPAFFLRP